MKTKNPYVFEWLDNLISFELNPAFSYPSPMPEETVAAMVAKVKTEMQKLQSKFRNQFFSERGEENSAALIVKNYDAIVVMINKTYNHIHHENIGKANIIAVLNTVMLCLQELRAIFQTQYARYLNTEQFLPITDLMSFRDEILEKRPAIVEN
jgi:hypothetical protein